MWRAAFLSPSLTALEMKAIRSNWGIIHKVVRPECCCARPAALQSILWDAAGISLLPPYPGAGLRVPRAFGRGGDVCRVRSCSARSGQPACTLAGPADGLHTRGRWLARARLQHPCPAGQSCHLTGGLNVVALGTPGSGRWPFWCILAPAPGAGPRLGMCVQAICSRAHAGLRLPQLAWNLYCCSSSAFLQALHSPP